MAQELTDFLIEVSNTPAQTEAFRADPDRILNESGLNERGRSLVRGGDMQGIQEEIKRSEGMHSATSIVLPSPQDIRSATGRSAISIVLPGPQDPDNE
jgi:hypothetical protein